MRSWKQNALVVCKDGFRVSIQANEGAYCTPRQSGAKKYIQVEVGFPTMEEELLSEYAEDSSRPTDTVYAYVPVEVVNLVIAKHGGIVSGAVPPGVVHLPAIESKLPAD